MIRVRVTLEPPGAPVQELGEYRGATLEAVREEVKGAWPYLPEALLTFRVVAKGRGFEQAATQAKIRERLRDPEVQRKKVAARLATEAARRAREAVMAPEERERLRKRRAKQYEQRWRQYWAGRWERTHDE